MTDRTTDIARVAGAILLSLIALPGQAQEASSNVQPLEAEFEAAASSLMAEIARSCEPEAREFLEGERLGFGLQAAGYEIKGLAPDQSHNLMLQIDEALKKLRTRDLVYTPTFSLERELQKIKPESRKNFRENVARRTHLIVTPIVTAEGDQRRFSLNADPAPDGKLQAAFSCRITSERRRIPPEVIGETFYTPAEIFRDFAGAIYDRIARERNQLEVVASDTKLDPLSDEAVSVILEEVNEYKSNNIIVGADPTPIQVLKGRATETVRDPAANLWTVELKLIEQAREAKLSIVATPKNPDAQALAKGGLVRLSMLPARTTESLQSVSLTGPSVGVLNGVLKSQQAILLPVGVGLQRLSGRIDPNGVKAFSILMDEPSILELDLEQIEKRKITLLDQSGQEIAPSFTGASRPNLRRYAKLQGNFVLLIENDASTTSDFVLRSRRSTTMLEPEPPGELMRTFGDWAVGVSTAQGRKVCFAYTTATEGSTVSRLQRPVIWFSIDSDKGSPLVHFLDDARFYAKPGSTRAAVMASSQSQFPITLSEMGGKLVPAQKDAAGRTILSNESIRGFTRGRSMVLAGLDENGRDGRIVYSLMGYKQAISSMAATCGQPELADKLVW
jgi:hypothetical protein